jgi:hypothetical protein
MYAGHPRWDMNIIVRGNAREFEAHMLYWVKDHMTRFLRKLQQAINASFPNDKEIRNLNMYTPKNGTAASSVKSPTLTSKQLARMGYPKETRQPPLLDDSPATHDPPAIVTV